MNEVQSIIRNAIKEIQAIPKDRHRPKWRNKVIDRLEEIEAIATNVPNMANPINQPMSEDSGLTRKHYDHHPIDKSIDLDHIDF